MAIQTEAWQAILLGIVEGLTEFLPVSSTGHLILAGDALGFTGDAATAFHISIQLGAILAVVVAYRRLFTDMAIGLLRRETRAITFTRNLLIGFVPAMVIGAFAYSAIRQMLQSMMTVAVALVIGGIVIILIERVVTPREPTSVARMGWKTALGVGVVQCLAMIPGVSRSGATIMGGLAMGLDRKTAAEFSFFLAVPTMAAATVYSLYKERALLDFDNLGMIAIGFVVSFLTALIVVKWFVGFVGRHGFTPFGWYRIVFGLAVIVGLMLQSA